MLKKAASKRPRQRRVKVTYCTITPADGKPLAFEACLALEARVHQFGGQDRCLIALVAKAWRQTYPDAPTEIALTP